MIKIYTIGVSGKGLDDIVAVMDAVGVRQLVDVRLWRASKFAPWAGGDNLERILGARYKSVPQLAPRADLLARYKSGVTDWAGYVREFNDILAVRAPEKLFTRDSLHNVCFLCMERRINAIGVWSRNTWHSILMMCRLFICNDRVIMILK